ncbi:hypothetical protein TorRG33x02_196140 [Trema orientale]|uniref:Uncharacterized protein n=1 Tax=Trema orientale TaxID=63057 RepID=A0A2P5EG73_TREOI|nr:hypothetical protein TorRG33x02_196140 [Trema orientale]
MSSTTTMPCTHDTIQLHNLAITRQCRRQPPCHALMQVSWQKPQNRKLDDVKIYEDNRNTGQSGSIYDIHQTRIAPCAFYHLEIVIFSVGPLSKDPCLAIGVVSGYENVYDHVLRSFGIDK